jgi:class 3 adenylate cyclase
MGREVLVERRPLTVLAGSIVGVPHSATESDPEELLDTMAALYRLCADAIKRYDGFVANLPAILFSPISAIRRHTKMMPNERYEPV